MSTGPKLSGIYTIVHVTSGQIYVGQAQNIPERLRIHRQVLRRGTHKNHYLQNAWNKHGEERFKFNPLIICPISELTRLEQMALNIVPAPLRYNFSFDVSAPRRGVVTSLETRRKLSEINRAENHPNWGKPRSEEIRHRIGKGQIGIKNHNWGKSASPEARAKMSANRAGKLKSDEHKRHIGEAHKRRISLELHGSKLSIDQVREIKELYKEVYWSQSRLAVKYGITQTMISKIITGKCWGYVS
jgi:group I intron endonuclease